MGNVYITCQKHNLFSPQLYDTKVLPSEENANAVTEALWAEMIYGETKSWKKKSLK